MIFRKRIIRPLNCFFFSLHFVRFLQTKPYFYRCLRCVDLFSFSVFLASNISRTIPNHRLWCTYMRVPYTQFVCVSSSIRICFFFYLFCLVSYFYAFVSLSPTCSQTILSMNFILCFVFPHFLFFVSSWYSNSHRQFYMCTHIDKLDVRRMRVLICYYNDCNAVEIQ